MLTAIALIFAVPPQAPPLEDRVRILEQKLAALEAKVNGTPKPPDAWVASAAAPVQTHPYLYQVGDHISRPTGPGAVQFYQAGGWNGRTYAPQQRRGFRLFGGGRGGSCGPGGCN